MQDHGVATRRRRRNGSPRERINREGQVTDQGLKLWPRAERIEHGVGRL